LNKSTNHVLKLAIIAPREQIYIPAIETKRAASNNRCPKWFGHLQKRRSTMTKSLILSAVMAISLGSGAAMAQEGGAQNLFNGSPRVFNEFARGDFATRLGTLGGGAAQGTYAVRSHQLTPAPDGSDGGGN
jgi:hypothetical protein